jgi:hypothetical protein
MAPPGTRIIAHETPTRRKTWAPHGQDGWYIGPALEHYRCYTVYITKTRSSRIVETVEFFPHQLKIPSPSSSDLATQAAAELTHVLLNLQPAGPFCQVGDEQAIALRKLATIFEASKPNKVRWKIIHLRGCKLRFHLRGWTPRIQSKFPSNTSYHHAQLQIRIEGNQHRAGESSHHNHMVWCDVAQGNRPCLRT